MKGVEIKDIIEKTALEIIEDSNDVLETKEILEELQTSLKNVTRIKLFYRLNNLRGNGCIKGKFVGPGKGVWIWWCNKLFSDKDSSEEKTKKRGSKK